jgi:hypothetical protein
MVHLARLFPIVARNWLIHALCLLVVGALAAVVWLDVPASKLLLVLLALACPLSHLLLGYGGLRHSAESAHQQVATSPAPLASTREYQGREGVNYLGHGVRGPHSSPYFYPCEFVDELIHDKDRLHADRTSSTL